MLKSVVIRLEKHDMARVEDLATAFNLVGGAGERSNKDRRTELTQAEREAKLFGTISTGQFTYDQVLDAVMVIKRRRKELLNRLNDPVFLDPKLQKTWADGIRGNADHAVRLCEHFLTDLKEDMMAEA